MISRTDVSLSLSMPSLFSGHCFVYAPILWLQYYNSTSFSVLAQARHILSSVQELTAAQDSAALGNEGVSYLTLENKSLQSRLAEQQQQYTTTMNEVTAELNNTRKEMVSMPLHCPTAPQPVSFLLLQGHKALPYQHSAAPRLC